MCSRRKKTKNAKAGLGLLMPYQISAPCRFLFNVSESAFRESIGDWLVGTPELSRRSKSIKVIVFSIGIFLPAVSDVLAPSIRLSH